MDCYLDQVTGLTLGVITFFTNLNYKTMKITNINFSVMIVSGMLIYAGFTGKLDIFWVVMCLIHMMNLRISRK